MLKEVFIFGGIFIHFVPSYCTRRPYSSLAGEIKLSANKETFQKKRKQTVKASILIKVKQMNDKFIRR
jgi:hypothetical protein